MNTRSALGRDADRRSPYAGGMVGRAARAFAQEDRAIPSDVRIVRDFANTVESQIGVERLRAPADLGEWLTARGLLDDAAPVRPDHVALAVTLREGLRGVLQRHAGHEPDPASMRRFDDALAALPLRARFDDDGFRLAPRAPTRWKPPSRASSPPCVRPSTTARGRGSRCARDSCRWAYYDRSRNRSSRWCTMAGCGNIVKMRRAHVHDGAGLEEGQVDGTRERR
jgi:predicted RNA-binding Zn ribbon-like protein